VLELLTRLVDQSLVLAEEQGGEVRYRLLESLRQYADEKLREAGEEDAVRRRHRDWYVALAERAGPGLHGPALGEWLDRLEAEHANLRAALDWTEREGQGEVGLRAAWALAGFSMMRGHVREGHDRMVRLLAAAGPAVRTPARCQALYGAVLLSFIVGDFAPLLAWMEECLAVGRELGYALGIALGLAGLGLLAHMGGAPARGRALAAEGVAVARASGDPFLTYVTLGWQAQLALWEGEVDRAATLMQEVVARTRAHGDPWELAWALTEAGRIATLQGDHGRALALQREAVHLRRGLRDTLGLVWSLESLAGAVSGQGQAARAARLLGAAEAARDRLGVPLQPQEQASHERTVAAARAALDEETFAALCAEGRAMARDEAIDYALADAEPPPQERPSREQASPLSPRELQVAALIARGHTNRQIAAALVISERTVGTHVEHILAKLGVASRAQIAVWAVERGVARIAPS
jgi:DNA-binding CsgD family transcriptional regulator